MLRKGAWNMALKGVYEKIERNIKIFAKTRSRVLEKFLVDAISGMLSSRSVNISDWARSLENQTGRKARYIYKRLDRALGDYDTAQVKERAQRMQSGLVDDDTIIYFDPTEVVKKHGRKFEDLCKVRDGSENGEIRNGYPVNMCIAVKGEEIMPLELSVYSTKEEQFVSENDEIIKPIENIAQRSRFKGKYVLDRGFDRFAVIRHLMELGVIFILRLRELRHFSPKGLRGKSYNRAEMIEKFTEKKAKGYFEVRINNRVVTRRFSIKACRVELASGRIDSPLDMWLIRARADERLTLYLLTNTKEVSEKTLVTIVASYLNRWKVEEFIRFVKQTYRMERFLVRDLGRIKNLFNLLFIALVVLARVSELHLPLSRTRALLLEKAKRLSKIPINIKFLLYTLALGLAYVLKAFSKKLKNLLSSPPKNQLRFAFIKETP